MPPTRSELYTRGFTCHCEKKKKNLYQTFLSAGLTFICLWTVLG